MTEAPAKERKRETREERRLRIAERIKNLPNEPGCYIMRDRQGAIFYVGKATDLRARVRSYFSGSDTRQFVDWLDDLLDDLDVIVVRNEKEALLLERTLVRQHQPRFNVKLRDDKNFIHLKLVTRPTTDKEQPLRKRFPRVEVVRGPGPAGPRPGDVPTAGSPVLGAAGGVGAVPGVGPGGLGANAAGGHRSSRDEAAGLRLFGPYHSATSARSTLRVLNRHFQLRTCRDSVIDNRARPCLQHQIGRCPAPCVLAVPAYTESLQDAAMFLSGRRTELADRLRERMLGMADKEDFEGAARVRDQLMSIVAALDDQVVTDVTHRRNQDVIGIDRRGSLLILVRVTVRDGRMQGVEAFDFDRAEFPTGELVTSWLSQLYDDVDVQSIPDEILLSEPLSVDAVDSAEAALADVISERKGRRVEVKVPQRGPGGKLVEIAVKNAQTTMEERFRKRETREKGLAILQERLGLLSAPRVIECFDISLFQGEDAVASQVCFVDGAPDKSRYRRFNIKTVEGTDDFAMLYEAVGRRLRRGKELRDLPDLIIVDGGKGQLNVALTACRDNGIVVVNEVAGAPHAPAADHDDRPRVALASIAKARTFNIKKTKGGKARPRPATPREERTDLPAPLPDNGAGDSESSGSVVVEDEMQSSPERLFQPGAKDPLVLRPHTADRFLVEQIRDEAHRFAITAHRGRRKRRTLRSVLDEIPGIGPEKRKALLRTLGSAQGVADADVAVVAAVKGIGPALAKRLHEALRAPITAADEVGPAGDDVDDPFDDVPVDDVPVDDVLVDDVPLDEGSLGEGPVKDTDDEAGAAALEDGAVDVDALERVLLDVPGEATGGD